MRILQVSEGSDDDFLVELMQCHNSWQDGVPRDILSLMCGKCTKDVVFNPNGVFILKERLTTDVQSEVDNLAASMTQQHREDGCIDPEFVVSVEGAPCFLLFVFPSSKTTYLKPIQILEHWYDLEILVQSRETVEESICALYKLQGCNDSSYISFMTSAFFR